MDDINSYVQSSISSRCDGCVYTADDVFGGVFSCPNSLPSTAVVYRSNVRGIDGAGCDGLPGFVRDAVRSNPSLLVLGNRLEFIPECNTSVVTVDSQFECNLPTESSSGISIAVIAGAAGGGAFVLGIVILVCVVLLVFRNKERKKRM